MAQYQETFELPSGGILYEDSVSEVTIRNITTAEEKLLLGSIGDRALDSVIQACIVEPKSLDVKSLIIPDKHFILIKLRILSYGSEYNVRFTCPECGKVDNYKIDLAKLPILTLDKSFKEPYEIKLPKSEDTLQLKIPRGNDLIEADRSAKKFLKKNEEAQGDISYIYRLMANIISVNGTTMASNSLRAYVEGMHSMDSAYLRHKINDIEVGVDTNIIEECQRCGEDVDFILPLNSEFFRPRFND